MAAETGVISRSPTLSSTKNIYNEKYLTQYAHDVVRTSVRSRFNVMDVVWMSKRCRVLIVAKMEILNIWKKQVLLNNHAVLLLIKSILVS